MSCSTYIIENLSLLHIPASVLDLFGQHVINHGHTKPNFARDERTATESFSIVEEIPLSNCKKKNTSGGGGGGGGRR